MFLVGLKEMKVFFQLTVATVSFIPAVYDKVMSSLNKLYWKFGIEMITSLNDK